MYNVEPFKNGETKVLFGRNSICFPRKNMDIKTRRNIISKGLKISAKDSFGY
jgi:hypothetical protein